MVVQKKGYMYAMIYVLGNTGLLALFLAQCPHGGFRPGARALARLATSAPSHPRAFEPRVWAPRAWGQGTVGVAF